MTHSDNIKELAAALAKAQGVIRSAAKSSDNPFFKSKYADLAAVWESCRDPLSANGLSVVQGGTTATSEGLLALETLLLHSSGEWISSVLEMRPVKADPQGVGSAITYMRRYALQAIAGIAADDDDGNAASGNATAQGRAVKPVGRTTEDMEIGAKGNQAGAKPEKGSAPGPESIQPPLLQDNATIAIETCGKAENTSFFAEVHKALPKELKSLHQEWARAWLKDRGFTKDNGEGSLKSVDRLLFPDLMRDVMRDIEKLKAQVAPKMERL